MRSVYFFSNNQPGLTFLGALSLLFISCARRRQMRIGIVFAALLAVLATLVAGCGVTLTPPPGQAAQIGTVQMWVTDAPRSDNVTEIWVTVSDVKIHEAITTQTSDNTSSDNTSGEVDGQVGESTDTQGWITVNITGQSRFDLLTLRGDSGGLQQILATANLTAGRYTQIRMTVDKVEVKIDGVLQDATLPSGSLKFVRPFDVVAGQVTKLLFDFDADRFVNVTGSPKNPKIMVNPVVKLTVFKPAKPQGEGAVKITTSSLPNGEVGVSYNATLAATGGILPYSWSPVSGNLTGGLILSQDGNISGTPEAGTAGDYTFTVKVSDNGTPSKNDTKGYTITIAEAGALIITTTGLPDGTVGTGYNTTLNALGGMPPYTWSITGSLPDGLELAADTGVISGTPTQKGTYNFTAQVSDNATTVNTDTQQLIIRITQ
jgi:hypothetical protein